MLIKDGATQKIDDVTEPPGASHPVFGDVISAYTRQNALEDGELVSVSDIAKEIGFKYDVAVTRSVWLDCIVPSEELRADGQSESGRIWDLLWILKLAIKQSSGGEEIKFAPLFLFEANKPPRPFLLRAQCHPNDDGSPCITIFTADEPD